MGICPSLPISRNRMRARSIEEERTLPMHHRRLTSAILMFAAAFFLLSAQTSASVYQPGEPVYVQTQLQADSGEEQGPTIRRWRIETEGGAAKGDSAGLVVFPADSNQPICRVLLDPAGDIRDADISGISDNLLLKKDLLIVPGYPAPCDILPVRRLMAGEGASGSLAYKVRRRIGGQVFADNLIVKIRPISFADASASGWLEHFRKGKASDIQVIEAVNQRSGEQLSLQLWQPGAEWWIYEETPYRKSWRVRGE